MAAGAPCGFKDTWKVWLLSLDPTPERQQSRAGERRTLCDEALRFKTDKSEWRRVVVYCRCCAAAALYYPVVQFTGQPDTFPSVRELSFKYTDEAREGCRHQLLNQHTHTHSAVHTLILRGMGEFRASLISSAGAYH